MDKYSIRKAKGSRSPFGKKDKDGYALFHDGKPIYPKFRNWWHTKAGAKDTLKKARKEARR